MCEVRRSSSSHSIKMMELPKVEVNLQFTAVRLLKESSRVKVFSARRLKSNSKVALKHVQKEATKKKDFLSEFHYNNLLCSHQNILTCFNEPFETDSSFVLTQELAPYGDLSKFVKKGGIGEIRGKRVARQVAQALEFMHEKDLVHRDVCTENIFVFDRELSLVKLGDFSKTQQEGALVKKLKVGSPWAPPKVSVAVYNEGYHVHSSQDAWQLGILIFVCLTGSYPWSSADITDRHYNSWVAWLKRKTTKMPPRFRCFTPRLLRLLRRLLEPKPEKRTSVKEVYKYLSDPWLLDEIDSLRIKANNKLPKIMSDSTKSLFTRLERKLIDLVRSQLRQPDPQPEIVNKKHVHFSFDTELANDADDATP
ncbi:hypothetical protein OTU49_007855 [Cherax quadricarinatus]|uniref:Protein kinase domain-containing protein n=1 Tax=Cherax quadricarinatus TaxID=27406 RepID=A0AAW0WI88_CHEQU